MAPSIFGLNGPAQVTDINPCPEIEADDGTGRNVVTGTMAHPGPNILYLDITGLNEPLGVTDTHPIWSESRQDFVVAGQLEVGEQFRTLTGASATLTKIHPHRGPPEMVFNLEVNAEHVFSVAGNGLLVHNACNPLRENMEANGTVFEAGERAGHIVPKKGWKWGGSELQDVIKKATDEGLIHDVANGFKATAGHLGTHKKIYVDKLIEEMRSRVSVEEIKQGMSNMLEVILDGEFS